MGGTTPKAQAVGTALRRAREDAGLSARQLANKIGRSHTTIGRWETGERAARPIDVATVLAALDVNSELRDELIDLARNTDERHWSAASLPEQQRQLSALLDIERTAREITAVSPLLIPGLLQTADYARAIMDAAEVPASEINTRVVVRTGRRDAITREEPVSLSAFIGETAIHSNIGGTAVMAAQLRALTTYAELLNVDLRVVPMCTGWHPALEGPFSIAHLESGDAVVHIENRRSGQFFHEPDDVAAYLNAVGKVRDVAMSPVDSIEFISARRDRMEKRNE